MNIDKEITIHLNVDTLKFLAENYISYKSKKTIPLTIGAYEDLLENCSLKGENIIKVMELKQNLEKIKKKSAAYMQRGL